jgi:hypothetical protein
MALPQRAGPRSLETVVVPRKRGPVTIASKLTATARTEGTTSTTGGFRWEGECGRAWIVATHKVETDLFMRRGRGIAVQIGDPDVILYCF